MIKNEIQYFSDIKPKLQALIAKLDQLYAYASILATNVSGTTYTVTQRQIDIKDYVFQERGFVVRVYADQHYQEVSFNVLKSVDVMLAEIQQALQQQSQALAALHLEPLLTPLVAEDRIVQEMNQPVDVDYRDLGAEAILKEMKAVSDLGMTYAGIFECRVLASFAQVNKLFLSKQRDLEQHYSMVESVVAPLGRDGDRVEMGYKSISGLRGGEILGQLKDLVFPAVDMVHDLLKAEAVTPGMYEVITSPEVSGLIAHEAFGHGVEMDMFVKERALAKDFIGEQVASTLTSMKDGAQSAQEVSSYLFDDEGTLGNDVTIIEDGILKQGISDRLSAVRLNTVPTGNGKRQSFERKAYARMTNTFFTTGNDSLEEMIASIQNGYLLEGIRSGMEDPKHWGIQCMVAMGHEIKDGKLTGKLVAPITLTGYVPDLLKSISMVSAQVELSGTGYCGKGYKEFVKVSDGGPYLKCKVRLG